MSDWTKRNARALLREFQAHGLAAGVRIVDYRGEDLRGQTFAAGEPLAGADFQGADLSDAQLAGVDLRGADLSGCRLTGARLDHADLRGARLTGAALDRASLIGADLRGATLDSTTWRRARLTGARLSPDVSLDAWGAAQPDQPPQLTFGPGARAVSTVAWHPGGKLLAVARGSGVELWDVAAAVPLATLTGHTGWVRAVAWSPDGTHLATGGDDRTVRIWNTATTTTTTTLTGHTNWVQAVTWSPDGTHLATASTDHTIRIWNIGRIKARRSIVGRLLPRRLRQRLISGTRIREARIVATIEPEIACAAFSADLSTVAVGSWDGSVSIIRLDRPEPEPTVRLLELPDSGYAAFWGDNRYRLAGDPAGRFWWRSGLCRFEPGELDGHGIERV